MDLQNKKKQPTEEVHQFLNTFTTGWKGFPFALSTLSLLKSTINLRLFNDTYTLTHQVNSRELSVQCQFDLLSGLISVSEQHAIVFILPGERFIMSSRRTNYICHTKGGGETCQYMVRIATDGMKQRGISASGHFSLARQNALVLLGLSIFSIF